MPVYIKVLKDVNGDLVLPKTSVEAVLMEDGVTYLSSVLDSIDLDLNNLNTNLAKAIVKSTTIGTRVDSVVVVTAAQYTALSKNANTVYLVT